MERALRDATEIGGVVRRWHRFDTYLRFPDSMDGFAPWLFNKRICRNLPLTEESVLECLDLWFEAAGAEAEILRSAFGIAITL